MVSEAKPFIHYLIAFRNLLQRLRSAVMLNIYCRKSQLIVTVLRHSIVFSAVLLFF